MKKYSFTVVALLAVGFALACSSGSSPTGVVAEESIAVDPSSLSLRPGQSAQLTVIDGEGSGLEGASFLSLNPGIATVTPGGMVTAGFLFGTGTIRAQAIGETANANVTVVAGCASPVEVDGTEIDGRNEFEPFDVRFEASIDAPSTIDLFIDRFGITVTERFDNGFEADMTAVQLGAIRCARGVETITHL